MNWIEPSPKASQTLVWSLDDTSWVASRHLARDWLSQFVRKEPLRRAAKIVDARPRIAQHNDELQAELRSLARRWRAETLFASSGHDLFMHPAYQRIIGLGPAALTFLLRELRDVGGEWHWALRAVTGDDPAAGAEPGNYDAMREAWLRWGAERKLI